MCVHCVRAGSDKGKVAAQHVEQLRQFVDRCLADDAPDTGDTRVALGDNTLGIRVRHFVIHGTEFQNLDHLIVEAVALLPEDDGAFAFHANCQHRPKHDRAEHDQRQNREEDVEHPFGDRIPVGNRLVENVEERHRSFIRIGARAKAQLVGMRRQPNIDRQHPQPAQQLQDALFCRQRQRHNQHVDARHAAKFHEFRHSAKFWIAGNNGW